MAAMRKLLYACCLLVLCTRQFAGAAVPPSDADTLLNIKAEFYTTAANQGKLEFWNSSSSSGLCAWPGVSCQPSSTRISSLSLQFRGLQGPLPDLLGSLPALQELRLDDNGFTGEIPPSLFQATGLETLILRHNFLSGAIPGNVSNLQALVTLDLRNNQLSGTLQPLQGLNPATLQFLYLDGNNLTGDLSPLKSFTGLVVLSVTGNQITGQLDALQGLTTLSALYLGNNQLNGTLSALATMSQLQRLDLGYNQFSGDIGGTSYAGLTSLQYLRLNSNNLSGELPSTLGIALRVVNLSGNYFVGSIPPGVCSIATAIMDLSENSLSGAMPDVFDSSTACGSLLEVWLEGNQLTGTLNVSGSKGLPLRTLSLSRNNLTGSVPDILGGAMPGLETLDLSHNSLQGSLPVTTFIYMDRLERLNMSHNLISGPVPLQLVKLATERLRSLDLSYNSLVGVLPAFPQGANYEYSFGGNLGLCSPDPSTQLPASCSPPPAPSPFPPPPNIVNPSATVDQAQKSKSASGNTGIVAAAVVAAVLLVLVLSVCAVLCVRRRRTEKPLDSTLDQDLAAAIQEGVNVIPMPVSMLRQATNDFAERNKLGVGGFGTVYKGTLPDGRVVAIKKGDRAGTAESKRQFLNEVRILSQVNYRGLVSLVGCCLTPDLAALVYEFVPQGTLAEHLRGSRKVGRGLSWKTRLKIAVQAADALVYLHRQANPSIFHRDVKSSNILLDDNLDAKVADFGVSKPAPLDASHVTTAKIQGTPGYIDPEYFRTFQLTAKSDVYSFGVVLLELLTAQAPLDPSRGPNETNLVNLTTSLMRTDELDVILDRDAQMEDGVSARTSMLSVARLALRCVKEESAYRPNMTEVLSDLQHLFSCYQTKETSSGSNSWDTVYPEVLIPGVYGLPGR